ncbi:MAG: hypothetical protein DRG39_05430 [Deltaproteobacteria bacterium]|nr:MAG: hypothetical protein DRG39_05430 [Deltaproteobacteria bacterium]
MGLRKTLLPLFRFPCYSYIIYSKDKNLCIRPNNRVFFCFVGQKIYFFNKIIMLFGVKKGFYQTWVAHLLIPIPQKPRYLKLYF